MSPNEQPSAETLSGPKSVAIITMSTRNPRVGPAATALVHDILAMDPEASSNVNFTVIDLADFNLPVFDEPILPAMVPEKAQYTKEHSKRWSAALKPHDGYVLVIPEYNGMTGGTKNAIDFTKHEWTGKPALIVSYGIHGGKLAQEQVRASLAVIGVKTVPTAPMMKFAGSFGPELFAAMLEGKLGEETKKEWTEEQGPVILKGFGEVRAAMFEPVVVFDETEKKEE